MGELSHESVKPPKAKSHQYNRPGSRRLHRAPGGLELRLKISRAKPPAGRGGLPRLSHLMAAGTDTPTWVREAPRVNRIAKIWIEGMLYTRTI